ncbi:SRPBCC family protein [Cohnella sp. REN36]|uniref:SRPBCC family protein n=1 Tax=Cohnella sp. REN36 TaxID=2887347 RepID=UPI001D1357E6|nr:SRPBCC family protein [Cohnella sp. REN36]MCC3374961.1 SRPBCC family protein [Cohnella sp. REN36]
MITIQIRTVIYADIETCFDLARDTDLHGQTVWPHTKEKVVEGGGKVALGDVVTFRATHLGVRQNLTSQVLEYDRPTKFVDQMTQGAFKRLIHTHEFRPCQKGTVMTDTLRFEAPFGLIGRAVERLLLKPYMRRFIEYRCTRLKQLAEAAVCSWR